MATAIVDANVDKNDSQQCMPRAKAGAPIGNGNAVRHGLTVGRLPKGAAYIARETAKFRGALERAVMDKTGGDVSLVDAAAIQTAIRWERHALLAQRWLRNEGDALTPDQRLAFSRDVARASSERDKCLRSLELNPRVVDAWPTLTAVVTPAAEEDGASHANSPETPEQTPRAESASDAKSEAQKRL